MHESFEGFGRQLIFCHLGELIQGYGHTYVEYHGEAGFNLILFKRFPSGGADSETANMIGQEGFAGILSSCQIFLKHLKHEANSLLHRLDIGFKDTEEETYLSPSCLLYCEVCHF